MLSRSFSRPKTILFAIITIMIFVFFMEIAARIAIRSRWSPDRIKAMTSHCVIRGKWTGHPYLPYVLAPNVYDHDRNGFRGRSIEPEKTEGVLRIACIGSSSTYGLYISPDETCPAQLEKLLRQKGIEAEVINAGVPGWVSTENLLYLLLNILPLEPHVVVVYQGRNELFPQAFNEYKSDYSHYRRKDYNFVKSNYLHKYLFKISHLSIILATYKGDRLGWSSVEENPSYGCIDFSNQPNSNQVINNLNDPARNETYRDTVKAMISACRAAGSKIVFCTFAFRGEMLVTGNLKNDPKIHKSLQIQVEENNDIVREVCSQNGVPVVETASLTEQENLFVDDCHMKAEGHTERARMILDCISDIKNGIIATSEEEN